MKDISANRQVDEIIERALQEDMPAGDITSESVIPPESRSRALIWAKQPGILAGIQVARRVFHKIDENISMKIFLHDGEVLHPKDKIAEVQGLSLSLLKGERTALNFLQRMSGIAFLTRKYVEAVKGTKTKVLDTRKTTPGMRILEKYSVEAGGGINHRMNLSDMVMLKDNHIRLVGSIQKAIAKARENIPPGIKIEVETTSMDQVKQALDSGADIIMLDNMTPAEAGRIAAWVKGRVPLEVSGMVNLDNIRLYAETGVDMVSVGSLTHSYPSMDIAMDFM
ncbi:MAG: carboxylating nicotinate-nucleotide diphosphorylase [Candidatus Aminicenantes bacterium]